MKYNIEDKPGFIPTLLYGMEWLIVTVPAILILGLLVAKLHFGEDAGAQAFYIQKVFFIMGFTLLAQILWGHKLPLVVGPATVLVVGIIASISSGINAIYTSLAVGGVIVTLVAVSGLLTYLRNIFTPRVVTVIMLMIPVSLTPTIISLIFGDTLSPTFSFCFMFLMVFLLFLGNKMLKGIWQSTTMIWGILIGSLVVFLFHGFPESSGMASSSGITSYPLLITPEFEPGVLLSFVFCAIAFIINEVGSIEAVGQMLEAPDMAKRNKRGLATIGISNILSGMTGTFGAIDFSSSLGVVSSTQCASRFPFIPAAILLILCAFFPSLVNLMLQIPDIVMGTLLLFVMTMQFSAGMQMMVKKKIVADFEGGAVIGLSLLVALIISFTPPQALAGIPSIIRPIAGNGFVMGVITVLVSEHIILRPKKEKV